MDKKPEKLVPEVRFKGFTDDWEQRKLGEVFLYKQGIQVPVEQQYSQKLPGLIRFIRISDIVSSNEPPRFINYHGTNLIKPDDLFMVRYGNPGMISMGYSGVIANNLFRLIPKKNIYTLFFYFLLIFENKRLNLLVSNTTMPALSFKALDTFYVNFPEKLSEQKVIGSLLKKLDSLITLQQRKLEQLKQLKKAMLQQLFVDKNNKQPNSRFKNFKGNWEQHRLEEVAQVTMGQSPSSKNYTDNPNDYVLVQGNADLKSNKISPRVWTKEITKQVHKGEIIMTVRAPVGYLAMANMDAVIGRGVAAIDGNKYLYYLLQTKLMDRTWEKLSSGSTFESISSNDIKNLEIKVTETEEEKLITKLMNTVTYFVTLPKNNLTQLTTLKKYLLQNLFI